MTETDRRCPVFVYGTLRPGQANWERLLAAAAERVVGGRLAGVVLLDCGHYPAAVERPGAGGAAGEVVWIQPHAWAATMAALDYLEGYDPADSDRLFDRVVRSVTTAEGPVDCWVYLAGRMLAGSARPVVTGGDWVAYCADP
ncbi:MAG: gamma-glutamylcyclotransferase family protein [Acidimicrobiia bacterium]